MKLTSALLFLISSLQVYVHGPSLVAALINIMAGLPLSDYLNPLEMFYLLSRQGSHRKNL